MYFSKLLLPCIIGITLSGAASAEIYETKDAEGNTVFSDIPSQGAEKIKLPKTNSADPPVDIPSLDPPEAASEKPQQRPATTADRQDDEDDDDYLIYGHDGDYDADDLRDREE